MIGSLRKLTKSYFPVWQYRQNHRMIWAERDLWDHPVPLLSWSGISATRPDCCKPYPAWFWTLPQGGPHIWTLRVAHHEDQPFCFSSQKVNSLWGQNLFPISIISTKLGSSGKTELCGKSGLVSEKLWSQPHTFWQNAVCPCLALRIVMWKSSTKISRTRSGFASFPAPEGSLGPTTLQSFNHGLIHCSRHLKLRFIWPWDHRPINRLLGRRIFIFTFSSRTLQVIRVVGSYSTSTDQLFGMDVREQALLLEFSIYPILGHNASKKILWIKRLCVVLAVYL